MAQYTIVTARDREQFYALLDDMERADGPAFLVHDQALVRYWDRLETDFPDYQFCLYDLESGQTAGLGRSIPLAYGGEWSALPDEGLDWVLEKGFQDLASRVEPNIASALYIEIAEPYRGMHLSGKMLAIMRRLVREQGADNLIAPVRPSLKDRFPLIDMNTYLAWKTDGNLPFDPWLRVHVRAGGKVLHPCHRAMTVMGTNQEWATWTGMDFPGDGEYVIPYGLVPLEIQNSMGSYVEPGIWVLHKLKEGD